mgnify:CR=1 FL=1
MENSNQQQLPLVIIINAISAGALLAEELYRSFQLIHIESSASVKANNNPRFQRDKFSQFFIWYDDYEEAIVDELRAMGPVAIIPGNEAAVALSDQLASRLSLPGNSPRTTHLRRDKYAMNHAASQHGLLTAAQHISNHPSELKRWYVHQGFIRAVVKPLDSAGSEDVYICETAEQVAQAAQRITGKNNRMHVRNHAALVQQFIEGPEYVVNTVSYEGQRWTTDIWKVHKRFRQGRNLYDYDDLCDPQHPDATACLNYTLQVLSAIEIVTGAGHTVLILSPDGPQLLETGARASGAANPPAIRLATGADQLMLMRYAYAEPEKLASIQPVYSFRKHLRCVHAIASFNRPFSHRKLQAFLSQLETFFSVVMKTAEGAVLKPTEDVESCPAAFFLASDHPQQIERDYQLYRQWEMDNL